VRLVGLWPLAFARSLGLIGTGASESRDVAPVKGRFGRNRSRRPVAESPIRFELSRIQRRAKNKPSGSHPHPTDLMVEQANHIVAPLM